MSAHLPSLDYIKDTKLYNLYEPNVSITASKLWENQPVLVMVVRRPGCKLCRAQVRYLNEQFKEEFERRNIKLIAVSHQEDSAKEFAEQFLGSKELYIDEKKDFYRCLGGGQLRTKGWAALFHWKFWKNMKDAGDIKGNLSGDGFIMGGLILIGQGNNGISWIFKEENFGDIPAREELLNAINTLVPLQPISVTKMRTESTSTPTPAASSSTSPAN